MRRALGLLGGNLGEVGLIVGATLLGRESPLSARQILAVNLVTDVLSRGRGRRAGGRARQALRRDVLLRGWATALPSLVASLAVGAGGDRPQTQTTAFGSVVAAQLVQTWQLGRTEERLIRPVAAAVLASGALAGAMASFPGLRTFLGLAFPSRQGRRSRRARRRRRGGARPRAAPWRNGDHPVTVR